MARVVFFEKPGCLGNAKQKALLRRSGHDVDARSLLAEPWTPCTLQPFVAGVPVAEWFNASAPQLRSGEIAPETLTASAALALLVKTPLLIRRPLILIGAHHLLGFDHAALARLIGLDPHAPLVTESCPKRPDAEPGAARRSL